jgi:UMF1 family MFS transporter
MSFNDDLDDDDTLISSPRIKYDGEDTSPTTDRELKAWYAYPIAAEVFAVVAVGYVIVLSFTQPKHRHQS